MPLKDLDVDVRRAKEHARCAAYKAAHPEKIRAYNAAYRAAHREEMLAYNASRTEEDRAYRAAYRKAHPEKSRARDAAQRAKHRETRHAHGAAYRATHREELLLKGRAYRAAHRAAQRAYAAVYRAAHREEMRAYSSAYAAAHTEERCLREAARRAKKSGAPVNDFTAEQWQELQAASDHRCAYCGKRAKGRLTQDHVTPLSKGGSHTLANIIPACLSCNCRKGTRDVLSPVQPQLLTLATAKKKGSR